MARALIAQLTATCGPADLRVVIVTDRPAGWESLGSLPHLVLPDATASIVDEAGLGAALELLGHRERTHLVVVTDCARALATRTGPLRRLLATSKVALLAALDRDDGVPHLCTAVLTTQSGSGWWTGDTSSTAPATRLRTAGLGTVAATAHARSLALLRDPEDGIADDARLPRHVGFLTMIEPLGARPAHEISERWHAAAHRPPRTPVGVAADGFVDIDLVRDGPHGLLAGTTGSGKSELLRTLVAGLALHTPPCRLAIVLVDYKGGATFDALVRLPHVVGVVTDLDGQLADRALRSLHAELRRREAVLREHGVADVSTLHERCPDARLPRLLVVIDEFAALVAEQPDFLHALVGVAQRGRSLGVHLLLATQRPNGVISDDIRANTDLRIALRLLDRSDAIDVVGDATPSMLPRTIPGRGVLRLADEHVTFQTAHLSQHDIGELVDRIVEADALTGEATPDAPWLPPLPRRLRPLDLPPGAIGMFDDPDHQTRTPLRWKAADGDVLVCGSSGTGRSSALQLLTGAALAEPDTHVYILHADAGCTALPDDHPRALRIHVADQERVVRLLHRLRETASTGRADASHVRTVLVVDDLDVVRRTLADPERSDEYDDLDDVLAAVDIRLVVSASRANGVPANVIARCAIRWVLHLHDPHDGGVLGVAATSNPPAIPGRAHVVPHGLEAQLALPSRGAAISRSERDAGVVSIRPIDPVAAVVHADTLLTAAHPGGPYEADGNVLPLGLDVASGATATLEVPDGEHVLVLGGARSGRSTTLTRFVLAWRTLHPHGTVVAVLPRRSSLDRRHVDRVLHVGELGDLRLLAPPTDAVAEHVLVVVDDAELVDDPDGLLGTLAGSRRPGLMIIAAARPDAIRQTYGHWTGVVRRSRLGVVATGGSDTDGDVLGVVLPRRAPLRPRPGLMWVIDRGRAALTQVAIDTPTNVDELRAAN
jgi:S-DNA-T family DNA segregation ATPase FtsK/SpoIIIE